MRRDWSNKVESDEVDPQARRRAESKVREVYRDLYNEHIKPWMKPRCKTTGQSAGAATADICLLL